VAAELLDVEPARVLMVAAHRWDLVGARNAGLATAFLERPLEKGPHRTADRPSGIVSDLAVASFDELADVLGCSSADSARRTRRPSPTPERDGRAHG
jgi:2-haloacid dehalogenase